WRATLPVSSVRGCPPQSSSTLWWSKLIVIRRSFLLREGPGAAGAARGIFPQLAPEGGPSSFPEHGQDGERLRTLKGVPKPPAILPCPPCVRALPAVLAKDPIALCHTMRGRHRLPAPHQVQPSGGCRAVRSGSGTALRRHA